MINLLIFLGVLSVLVFVHELGHFVVARRNGVKVHEFGFGFPPRIVGIKKKQGRFRMVFGRGSEEDSASEETIYSLNAIPLGGFVKIKGEQGEDSDAPDSFANKSAWIRFKILCAGVVMNFLLGFVLISVGFMVGLPAVVEDEESLPYINDPHILVQGVKSETPAQSLGLLFGDKILSIGGDSVTTVKNFREKIAIAGDTNSSIDIIYERKGEKKSGAIKPIKDASGSWVVGVSLFQGGLLRYPWYRAIYQGVVVTVRMISGIVVEFGRMVGQFFVGNGASIQVSGPVGIAVMTGDIAKQGFVYLVQFMAILSINLGVINLFPIPALDGGRILFIVFEKIMRRPVSKKIEQYIHMTGFFLLLLLMFVITFRDIKLLL